MLGKNDLFGEQKVAQGVEDVVVLDPVFGRDCESGHAECKKNG